MKAQERHVAIVGVGLIGRAWAAIFARAGWNVRLTGWGCAGRSSARSRPSNSMRPAVSRIIARATPGSIRNWRRHPPAPTFIKARMWIE
jgi:3-hydroxyacyl-CoA dehydrogenase